MRPPTRILSLAAVVLLALVVIPAVAARPPNGPGPTRPVAKTVAAFTEGDTIALRFAGRLADESTDPRHAIWTGELRSLATGEVVGTMTHDVTCLGAAGLPCPVLEAENTFRLPGGTIVSQGRESAALDPGHPGFALVGIHPEGNSIVSATGVYAGRTGRAHMSARHDAREYPPDVTFDDFWLIELDPRS